MMAEAARQQMGGQVMPAEEEMVDPSNPDDN
jgi:hypothetical protein